MRFLDFLLPTYKFYCEQIEKYISLLQNINEKYKVSSKYSVELQDDYGWFGVVKMLSGGDLSKHEAILNLTLNDCIAAIKMQLDENYSNYQKMKQYEITK